MRMGFENLKMKANKSVDTFMTQVMSVVNHLRQYGDDFENKKVIEKVLRSLPVTHPLQELIFFNIFLLFIEEQNPRIPMGPDADPTIPYPYPCDRFL
jgi:hypothetical protein